jgi:ribosomal protein S17
MNEQTQDKAVRAVTGRVVSNKMDKTITVLVERRVKHEVYGKYLTRRTKLHKVLAPGEGAGARPGGLRRPSDSK